MSGTLDRVRVWTVLGTLDRTPQGTDGVRDTDMAPQRVDSVRDTGQGSPESGSVRDTGQSSPGRQVWD